MDLKMDLRNVLAPWPNHLSDQRQLVKN